MRLPFTLIFVTLASIVSCTSEVKPKPARPDTSGMSADAARQWEQAVQVGPVSPEADWRAKQAAKSWERGPPVCELPPAQLPASQKLIRPPQP
ncbi:MAG: hypothetical protein K1X78_11045 [Verrucomicrobiaceae bacterium]|nr:hypothetical protein [Verrucomicrobiaceae bacterium]